MSTTHAFKIIFLLCALSQCVQAQTTFIPRNLGQVVNSDYDEFNPIITPDGKTLFFTRVSHPDNNHNALEYFGPHDSQDIWYALNQGNGAWSEPKRMFAPFNTAVYNSILSITDDGKTLLLQGVFNKRNKWVKRGLSVSQKVNDGWSSPERLRIKGKLRQDRGTAGTAAMSGDGQLMFLSFSKKFAGRTHDLYVSQKGTKKWSKPKKLPENVNTKNFSEESPYFNANEKVLYYSSNQGAEKKNKQQAYDIYSSKLIDESFTKWSAPEKITTALNSNKWESYFKLNPKGSQAYFASNRDSSKSLDLYFIKIFEENPFVDLSGVVKSTLTNKALESSYTYKVVTNNQEIDSVKYSPSTGGYTAKLPLGKKYYIQAQAANHLGIVDSIDATEWIEHTQLQKDLFVKPAPYVVLNGKVWKQATGLPFEPSETYTVQQNGDAISLLPVPSDSGKFNLQLKFGQKHKITVAAKGYESQTAVIDLTDVKEYQEVQRDFIMQRFVAADNNQAEISGQIIDKKTGKAYASSSPVSINANDIPATELNINNNTAVYKMVVPLGKIYIINASSKDYYPVYEVIDLTNVKTRTKINKDLVIAPIEVGMSVKLNNIFFETGKATLKKQSFPELDRVIKFLSENPTIKIEIGGHTDNVGKAAANQLLSQNRAASVVKYLREKNIGIERLVAKGYGVTKPVVSNKTKQGKAQNRRVEFTILEK